jgi:hypothetical protein
VHNESENIFCILVICFADLSTDHELMSERFECKHTCRDPKDGELCLSRIKPGETLVEVRIDSNVQIDRLTWV